MTVPEIRVYREEGEFEIVEAEGERELVEKIVGEKREEFVRKEYWEKMKKKGTKKDEL